MSHLITTPPKFGRVIQVDGVYGNDSTGKPSVSPYKTVNAAVAASTAGDTIWISPGTYELSAPITLINGTALRGMSLQTTTIQMTNVTSDKTLITMGENCRIEDFTIKLTSTEHHTLVGVEFPGTSSVTSKLRTAAVTVDNSAASSGGTSNVTGILCSGNGSLGSGNFSFNSLKGCTVNVYSNGSGKKRGIYVSGPGAITTRDFNLYVTGSSPGVYTGVECDNSSGEAQLRSSTLYGSTQDILQTSGSVNLGPGTDLLNKTAGGKNFSTYVYPTTIFYGTIGSISGVLQSAYSNPYHMYLMPGSAPVQPLVNFTSPRTFTVNQYPDPTLNYYSIQQKAIAFGLFVTSSISPGGSNETKLVVMKNGIDTPLTATLTDGVSSVRNIDLSVDFKQFDLLSLRCEVTGATNTTHDLVCQVDMY